MTSQPLTEADSRARTLAELEGLSEVLNAMALTPVVPDDDRLDLEIGDGTSSGASAVLIRDRRKVWATVPGSIVRLRKRDGVFQVVGEDGDDLEVVRVQKVKRSEIVKSTGQ